FDDRRLYPATFRQQPHSPVITGNQRSLGGRKRDKKISLRMFPVDSKRTGDAYRHLSHPDEVLDVPLQDRRIKRIFGDVRQVRSGLLADELAPHRRVLSGIVVDLVTWNCRSSYRRRHRLSPSLVPTASFRP